MSKGKPGKDSPAKKDAGSGRLEDDAVLWARVVETAQPLAKKNRFIDLEAPLPPPTTGSAKPKPRPAADVQSDSAPAPKPPAKVTVGKAPLPRSGLDRQTARRLD